jgi:hypothetical protein
VSLAVAGSSSTDRAAMRKNSTPPKS